ADGALHLPHQRGAGRARLVPDHARLSRQILERGDARRHRLHRRDRRRLQSDPRGPGRRPAHRRPRQSDRNLRHRRVSRGAPPGPAHRHHPVAPAGAAGHLRGEDGVTRKTWLRHLLLALLLVAAILAPVGQGNYITYVLTSWLIFSIAAMGLNLTLGYAGQVSLAQASFMAIGAYTTALLTLAGWHWLLAMPVGLMLCFVVGLVLGYPALRVQGHFLAFVTLAFNTLVFLVLRNEEWLTGGNYGL